MVIVTPPQPPVKETMVQPLLRLGLFLCLASYKETCKLYMYSSPKEVIKIENKQIQKETDSEQLVCFTN